MVAAFGIDAQLADDLKIIFTPVAQINKGIVQGGTVFPQEGIGVAQGLGRCEHVRRDDLIAQAIKLHIAELDLVQGLELVAEVFFQTLAIRDIWAVRVLVLFNQLG